MQHRHRLIILVPVLAALLVIAAPVQAARPQAAPHAGTTITIATVNNPNMIDMEHLTSNFTAKYGIAVKYVTLPENTLRQKVTADVATGGGQFDLATVGTRMAGSSTCSPISPR